MITYHLAFTKCGFDTSGQLCHYIVNIDDDVQLLI